MHRDLGFCRELSGKKPAMRMDPATQPMCPGLKLGWRAGMEMESPCPAGYPSLLTPCPLIVSLAGVYKKREQSAMVSLAITKYVSLNPVPLLPEPVSYLPNLEMALGTGPLLGSLEPPTCLPLSRAGLEPISDPSGSDSKNTELLAAQTLTLKCPSPFCYPKGPSDPDSAQSG